MQGLEERLTRKFEVVGDCWIWTASTTKKGRYGQVRIGGKVLVAHRVIYELLVGPIPHGMFLDHLKEVCTSTLCVNPAHLEPVTQQVNNRREAERRTACGSGHPWSEENTYMWKGKKRICRVCKRDRDRRYHADKTCAS